MYKASNSEVIVEWLHDLALKPEPISQPDINWGFQMQYPPNLPQPHKLGVVQPKMLRRGIVIVAGATLAPTQRAAFELLDDDAKTSFYDELQQTLNRDFVEYDLVGSDPQRRVCPGGIQIQAVIFEDGLSLDTLAWRLSSVYKAELAGCWCIQRHLGQNSSSGSVQFGFRKLGIQ